MQQCLWCVSFSLFYKQGKEQRRQAIWTRLTTNTVSLINDTRTCLTLRPILLPETCHRASVNLQFIPITLCLIFLKNTWAIFGFPGPLMERKFLKISEINFFLGEFIRSCHFPKYFWSIMFIYSFFVFRLILWIRALGCFFFFFNGRKRVIFLRTMR